MTAALATPLPRTPARPRPVSVRPAPRREPSFDDEPGAATTVSPLDQRLPFDLAPARTRAWQPRPVDQAGLPDPAAWARRLLVGLTEAAGGRRPPHQLATFFSPAVHQGIGAEFERAAERGAPHWLRGALVLSVRASVPAPGVAEISAVLDSGHRVRALALRAEMWHGHWRCTRLQIG